MYLFDINSGTKALVKVEEMINKTRLCNDVKKLSSMYQTSDLESFHSVINHFAPKMYAFSFHGMENRLVAFSNFKLL